MLHFALQASPTSPSGPGLHAFDLLRCETSEILNKKSVFMLLFQNYLVILADKAIFLYLKAVRGIEENQGYG